MSDIERIKAEIERRMRCYDRGGVEPNDAKWVELVSIKHFIESLEKEQKVDLESEEKAKKITPIGSDTIKTYGFSFGMYRYQVEHFDHNHSEKPKDEDKLFCLDLWDSIHGTRIYRFLDWEGNNAIHSTIWMDDYLEENEIKEWILKDVIDWKFEDPYDFKDLFVSREDKTYDIITVNRLFPKEKEPVKHNYPICENPYEKCPICGGELDDSVLEIENAADIFNSKGGYGYEGEPWGMWDEIHRCPHCGKLFCIEEEA